MKTVKAQCWLPAEPSAVFDYCRSSPGFCELFPYPVRWQSKVGLWQVGDTIDFRFRYMGVWLRHKASITALRPGCSFTDVMEQGIYRHLHHRHDFEPEGGGTRLTDTVEFSMGLGSLVDTLVGVPTLRRTFAKRHNALQLHFSGDNEHAGQTSS